MNKFKEIFEGNNNAYGQMVIQPGAITDKGKQKAKASEAMNAMDSQQNAMNILFEAIIT